MAEYVAGTNYTYEDYDWIYSNLHKYTISKMAEEMGRGADSLRGHVERLGVHSTLSLQKQTQKLIQDNSDLGDALVFLLPEVPLGAIREVLDA